MLSRKLRYEDGEGVHARVNTIGSMEEGLKCPLVLHIP